MGLFLRVDNIYVNQSDALFFLQRKGVCANIVLQYIKFQGENDG